MNLDPVITKIRTDALSFGGRVAGAAEYDALSESTNLKVPAAYVVALADTAQPNRANNSYRQTVIDSFGVVVVVSNTVDERGQSAHAALDQVRTELWLALLGHDADGCNPIIYTGSSILNIDRYRVDHQFEFSVEIEIDVSMTALGVELSKLPPLKTISINLDHKDLPPDGVIDHNIQFQKLNTWPIPSGKITLKANKITVSTN